MMFIRALKIQKINTQVVSGGVRLFVGVCGDADTLVYKRKPIMTEEVTQVTLRGFYHNFGLSENIHSSIYHLFVYRLTL